MGNSDVDLGNERDLEEAISYVEAALADHTSEHGNNPATIIITALRQAQAEIKSLNLRL